jgi:ATP-binding cassette subfamily C protein CydCD
VGVVVAGTAVGVLVVAQAFAVSSLVTRLVDGADLGAAVLAVVGATALRAAAGWGADHLAARAAATVGDHLRGEIIGVATDPRRRASRRPSGELALLASRGVAAAEPYLTRYLPALVLAVVLPPLVLAAMASQDLLAAAIVLVTLPLVPLFGALVGMATRDRALAQWRVLASLGGHFVDVVRGLPTLVAYRRAGAQTATIRSVTDRYRRATAHTLRVAFASSAVLELVATLSVALVAVVVGLRLAQGDLDLGTALVVLLLAPEAYWPLRRVGAEFHAAAEGAATFEQVSALLDGPAETEPDAAAQGDVELRDVTVTYPGRTAPAVHRLNATLPARGLTAVVGPSGAGKSTVLAALLGQVPVTAGTLTAAGKPFGGDAWRAQVAWLPQRPVFLAGSVADNLRLARPTAGDDDLWRVLRTVHLADRVAALPGGLGAHLGEDAAVLSAGERARLALARVVLADRPWLLLDEPTAHLDATTEQVLAQVLVDLSRTRGVVVVAHRPGVVVIADRLVTLPSPRSAARAPARRSTPAAEAPSAQAPIAAPARPAPEVPARPAPEVPARPAPEAIGRSRRRLAVATLLGAGASMSGLALTTTAGWLIVRSSEQPPLLMLLTAIVAVRAFGLARPVLRYAERLLSHDAALRLLAERRVQVYDALVPLTPGRLGRRRGDLLASVVDDVDALLDRELRVRMPVAGAALVGTGAAALTVWMLPAVGWVVAAVTAAAAAAYVLARADARAGHRDGVRLRAELSAAVLETVQVGPELSCWQAEGAAVERVVGTSRRLGQASVRAADAVAGARALVLFAGGAGVAGAALAGAATYQHGGVSAPMLALLVLVPLALVEVLTPVADAGAIAVRTSAAEERLRALERTRPAVTDPPLPVARPAGAGRLVVDGASAGWGDAPAFVDVDLRVEPGERVGVVGPSGSGKSTLAAMLLRFVDPTSGEVRLDGVPLCALALHDVRGAVGLVDDDPHVFASSLAENVRFARPGASDDAVAAALRRANLGEWLESLPDGLGTWLGDGGAGVSGGERARLGVARAVLAAPPVLVLDEPTAHLDSATSTALADDLLGAGDGTRDDTNAAVGAVSGEQGVVWITHGEAGLDRMDRVLDLPPPDVRAPATGPTNGPAAASAAEAVGGVVPAALR